MKYLVAEKFKSLQGEGLYTNTPMAFIRFVGCSVGKKICHACDTDFDTTLNWRGGGEFTEDELLAWAGRYEHICLTGGEPLDQDLAPLFNLAGVGRMFHIETSGTKIFDSGRRLVPRFWVCVSPKPGFLEKAVMEAHEVKVIVPGLGDNRQFIKMAGDTRRWPSLQDALRWAEDGKLVYLQPRNEKFDVDQNNLRYVLDLIAEYPQFRLSTQAHKILKLQ